MSPNSGQTIDNWDHLVSTTTGLLLQMHEHAQRRLARVGTISEPHITRTGQEYQKMNDDLVPIEVALASVSKVTAMLVDVHHTLHETP